MTVIVHGRACPSRVRLVRDQEPDATVPYGWMAILAPPDMHPEATLAEVCFELLGLAARVRYMRLDGKTGVVPDARIVQVCELVDQRVLVPRSLRDPFTPEALGSALGGRPPFAPESRSRWSSARALASA